MTESKVDGHIVRGIVPFGVGVASAPVAGAAEGIAAGAVSGSPLEMVLRWLTLLSTAALAGAAAFWLLQDAASARDPDSSAPSRVSRDQLRLAGATWALFVASNLVLLLNQASLAVGVSLLGAIGAPAIHVATETQYGQLWIVRVILGLVLGALLVSRGRVAQRLAPGTVDRAALLVGGTLLLSISLSSHSAAVGSLTPLGITADWLHLAAVAIWVGGLIQLAALVPSLTSVGSAAERAKVLGGVVPRFAVVAGVALAVLGVTGLGEALFHVGTLDNLLNSGYGQALLVKMLLILPLLAIAAINHFVIRPVFLAGRSKASAAMLARVRETAALFKWTVRMEVLFAAAVVAAAGVMTSLSPAQQPGSATAGPLTLSEPAGNLQTTLTLSPGRPGPNSYVVSVRDASGQVVSNVQQVSLRFTYLDSNLGVTEIQLAPGSSGRFTAQTSDLAVAGRWQAELAVRRAGQDDVIAEYGFDVTPNGASSLASSGLPLTVQFYEGLLIVVVGLLSIARGVWLRRRSLRRAGAIVLCGVCLGGIGGFLSVRDVQQAQAQSAASTQALAHPPTAQSVANGAVVFRASCAICHGVDARGDGPMAQTLSPPPSNLIVHVPLHPDGDLEGWIANGFPGSAMPAFQDKLTDQQRWDVLNYLKSQVSAANQASTTGGQGSAGAPGLTTVSPVAATSGTAPPGATSAAPAVTAVPASPTALPRPPTPTPAPTPTGGGLAQQRAVGDVVASMQIQPHIYDPADVEVRLTDQTGRPLTDVRRVDAQVAMAALHYAAPNPVLALFAPGIAEADGIPMDIWTMRPDGTNLRQIIHALDHSPSPAWAPDGKWIAVGGELSLSLVDPGGQRTVQLEKNARLSGLAWI